MNNLKFSIARATLVALILNSTAALARPSDSVTADGFNVTFPRGTQMTTNEFFESYNFNGTQRVFQFFQDRLSGKLFLFYNEYNGPLYGGNIPDVAKVYEFPSDSDVKVDLALWRGLKAAEVAALHLDAALTVVVPEALTRPGMKDALSHYWDLVMEEANRIYRTTDAYSGSAAQAKSFELLASTKGQRTPGFTVAYFPPLILVALEVLGVGLIGCRSLNQNSDDVPRPPATPPAPKIPDPLPTAKEEEDVLKEFERRYKAPAEIDVSIDVQGKCENSFWWINGCEYMVNFHCDFEYFAVGKRLNPQNGNYEPFKEYIGHVVFYRAVGPIRDESRECSAPKPDANETPSNYEEQVGPVAPK